MTQPLRRQLATLAEDDGQLALRRDLAGPAGWASGGVTTLTVGAFGIGSDCSFHRVYVADFTTFWIASPFCAERRAPVQAAFIGRQLLFTASDWVHPHFQSGHYGGRLSEQPAPSGRIEAPSPFVLAVTAGFEYRLEWL